LVDLADHYDLALEVILLAWTFELNQWAEALGEGAFDVLDALHELPKAAEVTKRALEAAYVKRTRPRHEAELRSSSAGDPEEERVSSLLCEAGQAAGGSRNILGSEREAVIAEPEAQATKPECRPETRT
jgi:DNA-binding NtrC family response regulator